MRREVTTPIKLLALVIFATVAVTIGGMGYRYMEELRAEREANEAAQAVHAKLQVLVAAGDPQAVSVRIPSGYALRFEDNGLELLKDGQLHSTISSYPMRFAENLTLVGGSYNISLRLEGEKVIVST